jgi:hypothetical protein
MRKVPLNPIPSLIMGFCKNKERSLSEISDHLKMNKNTLRANYLYPMVANKIIYKTSKSKNSNKYVFKGNT